MIPPLFSSRAFDRPRGPSMVVVVVVGSAGKPPSLLLLFTPCSPHSCTRTREAGLSRKLLSAACDARARARVHRSLPGSAAPGEKVRQSEGNPVTGIGSTPDGDPFCSHVPLPPSPLPLPLPSSTYPTTRKSPRWFSARAGHRICAVAAFRAFPGSRYLSPEESKSLTVGRRSK